MNEFSHFLSMLSMEFQKYLVEHQDVAAEVPKNAVVFFEVEGEDDFNRWHRSVSERNRERGQPCVRIQVGQFRSASLIANAAVAMA